MKLRSRDKSIPELSTAALPDLIFTILFFFMLITHMREHERKVQFTEPTGTHLTQASHKKAILYIYVGLGENGHDYVVQVGDNIVNIDQLSEAIYRQKIAVPESEMEYLCASINADVQTPINIIQSVKKALTDNDIRKISYNAKEINK